MRRLAPTVLALLLASAIVSGCRPTTDADINTGQALLELGDAITALREETSLLQQQVDSLRSVVARQDSAVRRMANLAGVPMAP